MQCQAIDGNGYRKYVDIEMTKSGFRVDIDGKSFWLIRDDVEKAIGAKPIIDAAKAILESTQEHDYGTREILPDDWNALSDAMKARD